MPVFQLPSQLHNYTRALGYHLAEGVVQCLDEFIEKVYLAALYTQCPRYLCDKVPESETQFFLINSNVFPDNPCEILCITVSSRITEFASRFLYHACILAESHGRRQVKVSDMIFVTAVAKHALLQ